MKITLSENAAQLGERAASLSAQLLNEAIAEKGQARLVLSTGLIMLKPMEISPPTLPA